MLYPTSGRLFVINFAILSYISRQYVHGHRNKQNRNHHHHHIFLRKRRISSTLDLGVCPRVNNQPLVIAHFTRVNSID